MNRSRSPSVPKIELELAAAVGFLSKSVWLKKLYSGTRRAKNKRWRKFWTSGIFHLHPTSSDLIVPNRKHRIVKQLGLQVSKARRKGVEINRGEYLLQALIALKSDPRIKKWRTKAQSEWMPIESDKPSDLVITLNNGLVIGLEISP